MLIDDLFGLTKVPPSPPISGLANFDAWTDEAGAAELLGKVDAGSWLLDLKRRVQHFGYRYDYRARAISFSDHLGIRSSSTNICRAKASHRMSIVSPALGKP
jgi:hypothetical protein